MSTTCKPILATLWFIKCKMAWKKKNQTYLNNKTSLHFRILPSFLNTVVLAASDEFLSSLYLLHRVDLVSLQLQQLVDGIFL